jgi:AraC family transcriptional regulator, transcriptional activator of pobA
MEPVYEIDNFNKVLNLFTFEQTSNIDIHILRLESMKNKDHDFFSPTARQHFFDISLFLDITKAFTIVTDNNANIIDSCSTLQVLPPFQLISHNIPKEILQLAKGYTVIFSFDFISTGIAQSKFLKEFAFFNISNLNNHFDLQPLEREKIVYLFERMIYEYEQNQYLSKQILLGYLWVLLNECKKVYDDATAKLGQKDKPKQSKQLFDSFQNLVATNLSKHSKVEEFADMLFVTPNHLTQSIKETSGKSPKEFITQRRLLEAKTLLLNSTNTVSEISYLLNFSEPTHFTKFFKKETSLTPIEFRMKNNA